MFCCLIVSNCELLEPLSSGGIGNCHFMVPGPFMVLPGCHCALPSDEQSGRVAETWLAVLSTSRLVGMHDDDCDET
jgi:hypothetical protein